MMDQGPSNAPLQLRGEKGPCLRWLPKAAVVSILASITYLFFRIKSVVRAPHFDLVTAAALWVEVSAGIFRMSFQLVMWLCTTNVSGERLQPQLHDITTNLPHIDVFIPCAGEDVDILLDTVRGALAQDYPQDLFRVIVLDDGRSSEVKEAIEALQCKFGVPLVYTSRGVSVSTHSKAANLNYGTKFASELGGATNVTEVFACLDVDMIPEPRWLRTLVPHLLLNPRCGLVCPHQRFYNLPVGDPLNMLAELIPNESLVTLRNYKNASLNTGSGWLIRRRALEQIGGLPEFCLLEDVMTSIALHAKGWQTIAIADSLQWGLVPDSFADWIRQRQRWTAGVLSLADHVTSPWTTPKVTRAARVRSVIRKLVTTFVPLTWTMIMFAVPALYLSTRPLLPVSSDICFLLKLSVADFVAQSFVQALLCGFMEWRISMLAPFDAIYTAPYRFAIIVKFWILPRLAGRPLPKFAPTGADGRMGSQEKDARRRRKSIAQLLFFSGGVWVFLLVLVGAVYGLFAAISEVVQKESREDLSRCAICSFAWPPLLGLWVVVIQNVWTPVRYALLPPPVTPRRDFLCDDHVTGSLHPRASVKSTYMQRVSHSSWVLLAACYLASLFLLQS